MSTVAEKLHKWSIQELNLTSEGGLSRLPDIDSLRALTKGKNKKIWTYVINHVRSQSTVDKVKRTLLLKKLVKEKEDNATFLNDNSLDVIKLQTAISKATEKRSYLTRSLSTVEERILNLEQKVKKTKDEIFQINQKAALLDHLKHLYDEKNSTLKDLFSQILSYKSDLSVYQSAKVCDKAVMALPYDFLYENRAVYDENSSRVKDLVTIGSSIIKKNFNQDKEGVNTLIENFQNNIYELKKRGVLLTDFVILLEEMSGSDLQQFKALNLQSLSVKEFILSKSKQDPANVLLTHLKCDNVYNYISAKKSRKEIEKLSVLKEKIFEDKIKSAATELKDLDYEVKCTLFEKLAENDALVLSNNYLEDNLKEMASKTDAVLKNIRQKKLCSETLSSVIQMFHNNADITFYLLYTAPDAVQKTLSVLNNLKSFAHAELFESPFPRKECIETLKGSFASDRKLTWDYCDKTNLVKPLFSEPLNDNSLSAEVQKALNFQPFQNISILCENWTRFKQKLRAEVAANAETYVRNDDVNVSEMYAKILKMLEKMKFSIEKGMLFVSDGTTCCHKTKSLIQEWWDQNAQYIPHIEYEGKTLKMWIDILSVLSDFEPQNYT